MFPRFAALAAPIFVSAVAACSSPAGGEGAPTGVGSDLSVASGAGTGGGGCISCPPPAPPISWSPAYVDFGRVAVMDATHGVRHEQIQLIAPATGYAKASFAAYGDQWSVDSITTSLGTTQGGTGIYAQAGDVVTVSISLYPDLFGTGVLDTHLVVYIGPSLAMVPVKATTQMVRNLRVGIDAYVTVTSGKLDPSGAYYVDVADAPDPRFAFKVTATNLGGQTGSFTIAVTSAPAGVTAWMCSTVWLNPGETTSVPCWADATAVPAGVAYPNAPFTVQIQTPTYTTTYPFTIDVVGKPAPPPPCTPQGQVATTYACCAGFEQNQLHVCSPKDPQGCGDAQLGQLDPRCCKNKAACNSKSVCGTDDYCHLLSNPTGTNPCGSAGTPALYSCRVDGCPYSGGNLATAYYCSQKEADDDQQQANPQCTDITCTAL